MSRVRLERFAIERASAHSSSGLGPQGAIARSNPLTPFGVECRHRHSEAIGSEHVHVDRRTPPHVLQKGGELRATEGIGHEPFDHQCRREIAAISGRRAAQEASEWRYVRAEVTLHPYR